MNYKRFILPGLIVLNGCASYNTPLSTGIFENTPYGIIAGETPIVQIEYHEREYFLHDTNGDKKVDEVETFVMGVSFKFPITSERVPEDLRHKIESLYSQVVRN